MKIKKIQYPALLLCLLIAGVLFKVQPVLAENMQKSLYNPDKTGSIQVRLDDIGTPRDSVSLYCYKIGEPKLYENHLEGFLPTETFENLDLDLNKLGDIALHKAYAKRLVDFIAEHEEIVPDRTGVTDKDGVCTFEELDLGVYLIVQKDQFKRYGATEPFLVTVPYVENDIVLYDVVTQTKGEKPKPPADKPDTENPKPEKPDKPAKTGDDAQLLTLLITTCLSLACIAAVMQKNHRKKNRE